MTDNLIAFFYRERLLVAVVSMLIMAGGILALSRLNVDAFPDVTPVQVEIDTEAEGLAPQEVEQLITFPIENVMNGVSGVVRVQSISKFSLSVVVVYFRDDIDIYFARQQVFEQLSLAKDRIPAGFEPTMGPITTGTGQIYLYQIVGRGKSNQELRTIQDWIVKLQLRTVPGVADVLDFGGDVKQYQVIVDQQALVNYNIPLKSLIEGEALVLLILLLLLGNFRSSFITAAAIPFCMLVAFIMMWYSGLSANLMSLGGLAISIGMMVDATVVMVENIYRHLEEHREHSTRAAILVAAQEIGRPMFFAILIIIAVFLPVFTLQGIEGKLFKPLAYAVTFSMIGSMLMALCIAPMLCALWLRLKKGPVRPNPIIGFFKGIYVPVLKWAIRHRVLTLTIAALLLIWSVADVFILGSEFLPTIDEGNMLVRATMPASISLSRAVEVSSQIEKTLRTFPEVETVVAKIGRAELGGDPESVSNDELYVRLKPKKQWTTAKTKDA